VGMSFQREAYRLAGRRPPRPDVAPSIPSGTWANGGYGGWQPDNTNDENPDEPSDSSPGWGSGSGWGNGSGWNSSGWGRNWEGEEEILDDASCSSQASSSTPADEEEEASPTPADDEEGGGPSTPADDEEGGS
jgi:hypothetical protein